MILAEKLVILRKRAGMSQEELASKLDISRQAVYKWEISQSKPDIENLKLISVIFNVSIDNLLNDKEDIIYKDTISNGTAKKIAYGKVFCSNVRPNSSDAELDNTNYTTEENRKIIVRKFTLWISAIASACLFLFCVYKYIVAQFDPGIDYDYLATLFFFSIALALVYVLSYFFLFKGIYAERSYFFQELHETETTLKKLGYEYTRLEDDYLCWFFYAPQKQQFGFYFMNREQFSCPIQNYINFSCISSGHGIVRGSDNVNGTVIFGDVHGFGVNSESTYLSTDDTDFNFILTYFDENGKDCEYKFRLDTYRVYLTKIFPKPEDYYAVRDAMSQRVKENYQKIKNKLDIEKSKLN